MDKIPIREFARQLGVSDTAVHKAIKQEKILLGVVRDEKGRPWIIPDVATREWGENYNPNYDRKRGVYAKLDAAAKNGFPIFNPDAEEPEPDEPQQYTEPTQKQPGDRKSLVELKRLQAEIRVQKEAIELRAKKGELVDKKKVYSALYEMGQEVRTMFQSMPDRVIDAVLAAKSRNDAHIVLSDEVARCLLELSQIMGRDKM